MNLKEKLSVSFPSVYVNLDMYIDAYDMHIYTHTIIYIMCTRTFAKNDRNLLNRKFLKNHLSS